MAETASPRHGRSKRQWGWLRSHLPEEEFHDGPCLPLRRGLLRRKSLDCYAEYFPPSLPLTFPEMTTLQGRTFLLSGVTLLACMGISKNHRHPG